MAKQKLSNFIIRNSKDFGIDLNAKDNRGSMLANMDEQKLPN